MTSSTPSALYDLVDEVVSLGGPLTSIVDHMTRYQRAGASAPDAPSIPEALRNMLHGVLEPLSAEFSADDLATATAILDRVTHQVTSEIYLVPPGGGPSGRRRRRRP